eukprot:616034-Alexandrium_andersonii.AAC.1
MEAANRHVLAEIFEFATGLKPGTPVDTFLHVKRRMKLFLDELIVRRGNRLQGFVAKAVNDG